MGEFEQRGQPPGASKFKLDDTGGNGGQLGFRTRLALTTALVSIVLGGYSGRSARAGACYASGGAGNYLCSVGANAATDLTQTLAGAPLTVTTVNGFGIDTSISGGNALSLTGTGGLTFTDNYNSAITGYDDGIRAQNNGGGLLSVTTTGAVTGGAYGYGIYANNGTYSSPAGTDLTISTAAVTGGHDGIRALNYGSGSVSVTSTGPVVGTSRIGINAYNSGAGIDLTISAASVTGGTIDGIYAFNYGSGALSVTATGLVTGANTKKIAAKKGGVSGAIAARNSGTDLTISAAAVTGFLNGISASNQGTGALSITASGPVTGTNRYGIKARNFGTNLTISAAAVTGYYDAIYARNDGSGVLSITASGAVTGGAYGHGIRTATGIGKSTIITLNSGAAVSAASGIAISNDAGDSTTTVNAGAGVTGEIRLGDGSDNLTFDGGNFSNVTVFDGGDDTSAADGFVDRLTFRNVTGPLTGSAVTNWENVVIGSGAVVSFSDNTLTAGTLGVTNGGTLSMLDGTNSTFLLNGGLDILNGGSLALDVFSISMFDSLQISGTADFGLLSQIDFFLNISQFDLFDGFSVNFLSANTIVGFNNINFTFNGLDPLFTASVAFNNLNSTLSLNLSSVGPPTSVPEPASAALFGTGLLGLFGFRRMWRRRRRVAA